MHGEIIDWNELAKSNKVEFCKKFFNAFRAENANLVDLFYDKDAVFTDPVGTHKGLNDIKKYYVGIYQPVIDIHFDFNHCIEKDEWVVLSWDMKFRSKKLKGGREIVTPGMTKVKFSLESNKVCYHVDSYDLGAMVYEHIPILSIIVKKIKGLLS